MTCNCDSAYEYFNLVPDARVVELGASWLTGGVCWLMNCTGYCRWLLCLELGEKLLQFFIYRTSFVVGGVAAIAKSMFCRKVRWFGTYFCGLTHITFNTASWVWTVAFCMAIRLAILTLGDFAAFVWFFYLDFCVQQRIYVEYFFTDSFRSKINNKGNSTLVCWCFIFVTCLMVKPISSSVIMIAARSGVGWIFLITTLIDLSHWDWNVWYSASWFFKEFVCIFKWAVVDLQKKLSDPNRSEIAFHNSK